MPTTPPEEQFIFSLRTLLIAVAIAAGIASAIGITIRALDPYSGLSPAEASQAKADIEIAHSTCEKFSLEAYEFVQGNKQGISDRRAAAAIYAVGSIKARFNQKKQYESLAAAARWFRSEVEGKQLADFLPPEDPERDKSPSGLIEPR